MFGKKKNTKQDEEFDEEISSPIKEEYENPYITARKEYGDRYGAAVSEAARWRQISFFLLLLTLAFGALMIWLSSQNKVVPYVVQVDEHGYSVAIKPATQAPLPDTRIITSSLSRFFINLKTVMLDSFAQRRLVDEVYNYIGSGTPAENYITRYYRSHSPFGLKTTTQVEIQSVLGVGQGGKSWQVTWFEKVYENGILTDTTQWRAIATITVSPVRDLQAIIKNPLGIYLTEVNMTQEATFIKE